MAYSFPTTDRSDLEFSLGELTGALGDSITVLPLLVALAATTSVSLPHVLVGFGVFQIVWGLYYGMPLSVEPMKALVGLAIVGSLSYPELAAAGLLAGGVLLTVGQFGLVGRVQRVVGEPVIRGVQFAVALLLLESAVDLSLGSPTVAGAGLAVVGLLALAGYRQSSVLVVLGLGGAAAVAGASTPVVSAAVACAIVAWDSAVYGVSIVEELGREPTIRRPAVAHATGAVVVGVVGIALALGFTAVLERATVRTGATVVISLTVALLAALVVLKRRATAAAAATES